MLRNRLVLESGEEEYDIEADVSQEAILRPATLKPKTRHTLTQPHDVPNRCHIPNYTADLKNFNINSFNINMFLSLLQLCNSDTATNLTMASTLTTFHLFSQLPAELKAKGWEEAAYDEKRLVTLSIRGGALIVTNAPVPT